SWNGNGGRYGAAEDGRRPAAVGLDPDVRGGGADARDGGRRGAGFAEDLSAASAGGSAAWIAAPRAATRGKTSALAGKSPFQAGPDGPATGGGGWPGILRLERNVGTKRGRAPSKELAGKEIRAAEGKRQIGANFH